MVVERLLRMAHLALEQSVLIGYLQSPGFDDLLGVDGGQQVIFSM